MGKITFKEHEQFGKMCKMIDEKLMNEQIRIIKVVGSSKIGKLRTIHYKRAIKSLGRLRDSLEEIMYKDYPKNLIANIYYGKR